VDAIIGARGLAHTVLADECTGCALCLPVCPVDCIRLEPVAAIRPWQPPPTLQPEPLRHGPG
jgi:electron transport complex protein RnfB